MKRPMVFFLLFYLLGLVFYDKVLLSSIVVAIWVIFLYKNEAQNMRKTFEGTKLIILFVLFYILGVLFRYNAENFKIDSFEKSIKANETLQITVKVKEIGQEIGNNIKTIVETEGIYYEDSFDKNKYSIQAYIKSNVAFDVGDKVTLIGKVYPFSSPRNKGQYDEKTYMKTKKIYYKFYGEIKDYIKKSDFQDKIFQNIKSRAKEVFQQILPKREAGLVNSMLIGDNSSLDKDLRELYNDAGISHIIAISGMHILVICAVIYKILGLFIIERKPKATIAMILLIIYGILTGGSASALRAVVMGCVLLFAVLVDREKDKFTNIAFAALVLLLFNPMNIYDVGFLLSFSAVVGIMTTVPLLDKMYKAPKLVKDMINATLAAIIWTTPIIAYFFYEVPTYALIVNLLVLPLSTLLLIISILGFTVGLFWLAGAKLIMLVVQYILIYYEFTAKWFVNLPVSKIVTGQPSLLIIALFYGLLVFIFWYYQVKPEHKKKYAKYKMDIIFFSIFIVFYIALIPKGIDIEVLDVGQGDSIVIQTHKQKNILVDGGGQRKEDDSLPNTGKTIVNKYLKYKGISRLDVVIATHPDYDHIKGILELIDMVSINKIILPIGACNEVDLQKVLVEKANTKNIPIYFFKEDDKFIIDDIVFTCLYPSTYVDNIAQGNNDYSLVFKMDYKDKSLLLTGDIGDNAESIIVNKYKNLHIDILKVAHHGSENSTSQEFLEATKPKHAVISVGNNNYGHPSRNVIDRLEKAGAQVYITKNTGSINIRLSCGEWIIKD